MTVLQAFFLGCVQGLTEFLPISSSAHLSIFQSIMGIEEKSIVFDVFVHVATLAAIILFFWKDITNLKLRDYFLLAIATIPAVLVGLFLRTEVESLFTNTLYIGFELILTGLINFAIDYLIKHKEKKAAKSTLDQITFKDSFIVGTAQAIGISPGISRSGSTVLGGMLSGFNRELAFRFSFLMAIPAIIGAAVLQYLELQLDSSIVLNWPVLLAGGFAAFLTGIVSLLLFKYVMNHAKLNFFGYYCVVFGIITIFFVA